jgi:hypothetical protein
MVTIKLGFDEALPILLPCEIHPSFLTHPVYIYTYMYFLWLAVIRITSICHVLTVYLMMLAISHDHIQLNDLMNLNISGDGQFMVLSQHLPRANERNHEKPLLGQLVS